MSTAFPILSVGPLLVNPSPAVDPSIRSSAEDGQVISRRRFTGNKKQFELTYDNLTAADKVLLETLQNAVGVGADTITWTNEDPNDLTAYVVRLSPEGFPFENKPSDYSKYMVKFTFIED